MMRRRYGPAAGRRFGMGMGSGLLAQQTAVGVALRGGAQQEAHDLGLVDLMTLTRGGSAAILAGLVASGVRDRPGPSGRLGWLALLFGAILCDWLDGPLARRFGGSETGAMLDIEADSWLTLCSSVAGIAWGGLPSYVMVAPLARYGMLLAALRRMPYRDIHGGDPSWVRRVGMAQMMLFIASLAPFGGRATNAAVRIVAPVVAPLALGSLLLQWRWRLHAP